MQRVLILGAGFGGLELATTLSESLADQVEVTLIDKSDSFVFGYAKLDVMFGRSTPGGRAAALQRRRQTRRAHPARDDHCDRPRGSPGGHRCRHARRGRPGGRTRRRLRHATRRPALPMATTSSTPLREPSGCGMCYRPSPADTPSSASAELPSSARRRPASARCCCTTCCPRVASATRAGSRS